MPNVRGRCCVITSKVSPKKLAVVWQEELVSNISLVLSKGNTWCLESVFGKWHPWCCNIHWAHKEEDCLRYRCFLRPETSRMYPLRIWRVNNQLKNTNTKFVSRVLTVHGTLFFSLCEPWLVIYNMWGFPLTTMIQSKGDSNGVIEDLLYNCTASNVIVHVNKSYRDEKVKVCLRHTYIFQIKSTFVTMILFKDFFKMIMIFCLFTRDTFRYSIYFTCIYFLWHPSVLLAEKGFRLYL